MGAAIPRRRAHRESLNSSCTLEDRQTNYLDMCTCAYFIKPTGPVFRNPTTWYMCDERNRDKVNCEAT